MAPAQLPLPFLPGRSCAAADLVPGAANAEARAWLSRWPDWPSGRLALWGPAGSGKSHLAAIWRMRSGARALSGPALAALAADAVFDEISPGGATLVEDADQAPQGRALLHLLNAAAESGGTVLLTARTPPQRWAALWRSALPDLASRLAATQGAAITAPDEALVKAVLAKHLADRQVTIRPDLLSWLALRLPRDFATVAALAEALDQAALAAKVAITRPVAAAALARALAATGHDPGGDAARDDTSIETDAPPSPPGGPMG